MSLNDEPVPSSAAPASAAPPRPLRGGIVTLAWELRTVPVRRTYRRDFPAIGRWLHGLERARSYHHVPSPRVDAATQAITAQVDAAFGLFTQMAAELDRRVAAAGFADVPFHDPEALTVAAPVSAPLARTYLQLLTAADDAYASVERAWLLGVLDHRERRRHDGLLNKALSAVTAQVREEYSTMARWLTGGRDGASASAVGNRAAPPAPPDASVLGAVDTPGGEPAGTPAAPPCPAVAAAAVSPLARAA